MGNQPSKQGGKPAKAGSFSALELDLKEKSLDRFIADAKKQQLKEILSLDLSRQELATLPWEIGKLSNLKVLRLYDNDLKVLPKEIGS